MDKEKYSVKYEKLPPQQDAIALEGEVLGFWEENDVFERSIRERPEDRPFVFFEGPPTANGRPGVHHAMSRTIKDLICRYKTMKGFRVERKAGWDTHGLPVEIEVEQKLGLDGKDQIEDYGIEKFNAECRQSVFKYLDEWHDFTRRLGYWLDLEHPYVTCDNDYIESVWWILKQFWDRDMLYEGHKIVPYCPRCGTALSSHEVSQGYMEISDPSIYIKMKLADEDVYFLVWTTTPWTLLSNVALAVGPHYDYVKVIKGGNTFILAESRLEVLDGEYEVLDRFKGKELIGRRYEPVFSYFKDAEGAFRVIEGDFVTLTEGTGIVHIAPAFGEDDYRVGRKEGLPFLQPVNEQGRFTDEIERWAGRYIKDADKEIIEDLRDRDVLYRSTEITHSYPFCWRCKSPLIYYARRSWYIKTTAFKDLLIEANSKVKWYPPEVGENRFARWLEGNVDWALSRERYWGTPLNIWQCESCKEQFCVGSIEELSSISEPLPDDLDLHRPYIDELDVGCPVCGGRMKRVPEVIDCWFDSGSMPFAQHHYPMENMEKFKKQYPADFISEGVDQSRGWFYSLLVIGAFLTNRSPYERVLPHGMILDAEGQKMSKSRGNAVFASDVLKSDGADALRWYLMTSGAPYLPKRFDIEALRDSASRFLGTLRNLYNFYAMYAELDGFVPTGEFKRSNTLDRWILSRFNSMVKDISNALDEYEMTRAARLIQGFVIDELSNWYLRRSRRRFWKNEMSGDKVEAYETFYHVLEGVSKVTAPFIPFLSEAIYQRLNAGCGERSADRGKSKGKGKGIDVRSVHLEVFPESDGAMIDSELEEKMMGVLKAVYMGRAVRSKVGIKIRTPLAEMMVSSDRAEDLLWVGDSELEALVTDELNVKKITAVDDTSSLISYHAKPNYAILGKRLGKLMKDAAKQIEALSQEDIAQLLEKGTVTIDLGGVEEEIRREEVQILHETVEGYSAEVDEHMAVLLDVRLTPELIEEGMARDIVNRIQNFRKNSGLDVSDRIELFYSASPVAANVFKKFEDYIGNETLARSIEEGEKDWEHSTKFSVNNEEIMIWLRKIQ